MGSQADCWLMVIKKIDYLLWMQAIHPYIVACMHIICHHKWWAELWHKYIGHVNFQQLKTMQSHEIVR